MHHGPEQPLHDVPQLDPLAVAGAGGQVARGVSTPGADAGLGRVLIRAVPDHLSVDPGDVIVGGNRLEHAGLDVLPQAGPLPHVEGRGDAANQRRGGGVAYALSDDVIGTLPRVLAGKHHHPPALGSHHGVVTLVFCVGTMGAEAGQRGIYQDGMSALEGVVIDAQPLGNAGPVILDDNVSVLRQRPGSVLAVGCLEVEDDAFLAAVPLDGTG